MLKTPIGSTVNFLKYRVPKWLFYTTSGVTVFGIVCLTKDYVGGKRLSASIMAENKVAIVTGANSGIGKEICMDLARRQAKVYMACRDMQSCEKTRETIVLETKNKYVYCRKCDLASIQSVRNFVAQFETEQSRLDILINNAGVMRTPNNAKTRDGFEMQLGVNHLGHFLLTNLLLDKLKSSKPSRIVNVSSVVHTKGKINKNDLNSDLAYDPGAAYAQSKLANVLFTLQLAERLKGTDVTVNAVHPGTVNTAIVRHMSFFNSWLASLFVKPLLWPFIRSPFQGAFTPIYVALSPELTNVSGKYFSNCKEEEIGESAKDSSTAKWLWAVSEKWTRLTN